MNNLEATFLGADLAGLGLNPSLQYQWETVLFLGDVMALKLLDRDTTKSTFSFALLPVLSKQQDHP
jgi:hypothetical protein